MNPPAPLELLSFLLGFVDSAGVALSFNFVGSGFSLVHWNTLVNLSLVDKDLWTGPFKAALCLSLCLCELAVTVESLVYPFWSCSLQDDGSLGAAVISSL